MEWNGARQMALPVKKIHDAEHLLSHRTVRESLNQRLETEVAKILAKTHLDRARGGGGENNTGSGSSAGGAAVDV
jgi:hypothetical protein